MTDDSVTASRSGALARSERSRGRSLRFAAEQENPASELSIVGDDESRTQKPAKWRHCWLYGAIIVLLVCVATVLLVSYKDEVFGSGNKTNKIHESVETAKTTYMNAGGGTLTGPGTEISTKDFMLLEAMIRDQPNSASESILNSPNALEPVLNLGGSAEKTLSTIIELLPQLMGALGGQQSVGGKALFQFVLFIKTLPELEAVLGEKAMRLIKEFLASHHITIDLQDSGAPDAVMPMSEGLLEPQEGENLSDMLFT